MTEVRFGLDAASAYRLVPGRDAVATAGPQAAWYFADELVAVPLDGAAGYAHETRPFHDLRRWSDAHARAPRERPPLVWVGDAERVRQAQLGQDAHACSIGNATLPLRLVDPLPTNTAWFDASSAAFFASAPLSMRGHRQGEAFVARSLWPEAWRLGPEPPPALPLPEAPEAGLALRSLMRAVPARTMDFAARSLWQRAPGGTWGGKAVLAFIVNGAQGDDDEAHGGHFSIATGRIADDGDFGEWLVNSIYALDSVSEKGILAAPVPLERYQGDLNSGQSWYRPTWMLAAILDDERAAVRVQSALGRLYRHFWRGQLAYYHPTDNCTSIAIEALRALGLDVPARGPTARVKAWLALPWLLVRDRSLANAQIAFDYLVAERTRLLPSVALEAVFEALVSLAQGPRTRPAGRLGAELAEDLAALAWLQVPQFPSSRAWGDAPAISLDEYQARVPKDPAQRRIIPLPPRVLPEPLREEDLLPRLPHPSELAVRWWTVAPLAAAALALVLAIR